MHIDTLQAKGLACKEPIFCGLIFADCQVRYIVPLSYCFFLRVKLNFALKAWVCCRLTMKYTKCSYVFQKLLCIYSI